MLCTHCKNYAAYRTTNERLSKRGAGKKAKASMVSEDRGSMVESESAETSLLTYDDVIDSQRTNGVRNRDSARNRPQRASGCCGNFWKMSTHTRIIPQERLYDYLADRSVELDDS